MIYRSYNLLSWKEKEKKNEQAEKMAKQKQQREAEQTENEKNDNLCLDLATNLKNRAKGLWGDKIEEDNDEDDYKANDRDNNPQLPSYEKDTYNNVPFTQLSPAKQEKIIQEYKKGELERFYYEKAQAETTNKKNTWEKVPPVVKKAITDKYAEDKQKKIIEYYYINYYKHNKRSFDQLSLEQRKQVERAFNNFIDKEEVKESYEWECDKNIRKIHSEDPQFKYNVAFFELNNGLQIRKKEEYIQKKENKERKKQEDAVKAKKSAEEQVQRTRELKELILKVGAPPPPPNAEIGLQNNKIKELESKIRENKTNNGTKEERKRLKEELEKSKAELEALKKEQEEERIRVLKERN